jgi:hypothetical protein
MSFTKISDLVQAAPAPTDFVPYSTSATPHVTKKCLVSDLVSAAFGGGGGGGGGINFGTTPTVNGQPILSLPTSSNDGEHLIYEGLGTTDVKNKKLLIKAAASPTTNQLNFSQFSNLERINASFGDILANFYRFSYTNSTNDHRIDVIGNHGGRERNDGNNEEGEWDLNSSNEISQTINSISTIGFASIDSFDTYDAMIVTKSTGSDDDIIGWVIALNRGAPNDPAAQTPCDSYISVHRALNAGSGSWSGIRVEYNYGLPGAKTLFNIQTGFSDAFANSTGGAGWGGYAGCPLKIERRPDYVKIWAIDNLSNAPAWDDAAWGTELCTIDLTTDSDLTQFQAPTNWGLMAQSQGFCSWGDLFLNAPATAASTTTAAPDPALNNYVFDIESNTTWVYRNGSWQVDPARSIHDFVDSGQLLYDTTSKTLSIKDSGTITKLISPRPTFDLRSANFTVEYSQANNIIRADAGCNVVSLNGQYGAGFECTILNLSGVTLTLRSAGVSRFNSETNVRDITMADNQIARVLGNGLNNGQNVSVQITSLS